MNNNAAKASHILNASTNLVGFSFLILTSLKVLNFAQYTFADEIAAFSVVTFILSSTFSFASIRSKDDHKSEVLETIADYVFLGGLLALLLVCVSLIGLK
jgi:hypothetical protein